MIPKLGQTLVLYVVCSDNRKTYVSVCSMWTVSEFANTIKETLNTRLRDLSVKGEVVDVTRSQIGHCYFEITDGKSCVNCVAWSGTRANSVVKGKVVSLQIKAVEFYTKQGRCQAIVSHVIDVADGCGDVHNTREAILRELRKNPSFAHTTRELPGVMQHLCIITSAGSAACCDMVEMVNVRWPGLKLTLIDSLMQGASSPRCIANAIGRAQHLAPRPDVIVIGRGGGSANDLQTFDERIVLEAIIESAIPTVSAIGHESDHPISDHVADYRAKTPTDAIVLLLPKTKIEIKTVLSMLRVSLQRGLRECLHRQKNLTSHFDCTLKLSAISNVQNRKQGLQQTSSELSRKFNSYLNKAHKQLTFAQSSLSVRITEMLKLHSSKLQAIDATHKESFTQLLRMQRQMLVSCNYAIQRFDVNPTLKRGFCILRGDNNEVIKKFKGIVPGTKLYVHTNDGILCATVNEVL